MNEKDSLIPRVTEIVSSKHGIKNSMKLIFSTRDYFILEISIHCSHKRKKEEFSLINSFGFNRAHSPLGTIFDRSTVQVSSVHIDMVKQLTN